MYDEVILITNPGGTRTVRVEQILYQPEAAGHYHV
jgi:hypothetical protein